jgi:LuxR family maltose regulon positive regulatory protein
MPPASPATLAAASATDATLRARLAAKLSPPSASGSEVPRGALCDLVEQAPGARVVLVRAPAGFGKTTALLQARDRLRARGIATGWLTLDAADNDPSRFVACLAQAVAAMFGADVDADTTLDAQPDPASEPLGAIELLATGSHPFALVLDDFECLQEAAVLGLVREIIDHLPAGGRLLIGSRSLPALGLGRLRVRGQLLEIDAERLRFSLEETTEFLVRRRHLTLPPEALARLHRKTEGWAAALWLASLALQGRPSARGFVEDLSGSERALADYLAEDVLAAQPQPVRDFLLRTCVLRHLNPALCDALAPGHDSAAMLAQLHENNLFVSPLQGEAGGWRYHSLFASFLREQLARERPSEAAGLHLAASRWYELAGRPVPAIDHAIDSGEQGHALALLERHAAEFLAQGRMRLLARWFAALPDERLAAHPGLAMIAVWAACFTRGAREAFALLGRMGCAASPAREVQAHLRALRPVLLAMSDRLEQAYEIGQESLGAPPGADPFADSVLTNAMAHVVAIMGEHRQAQRLLDAARRAHGASAFNRMYAESVEGMIDLREGRLRQASARFRIAVSASGGSAYGAANGNAWAGVLHAGALYEGDRTDEADHLLSLYLPAACDVGLPDHMILGYTMRARIAFWRGDVDLAFQLLVELEYLGHERQLTRVAASAKLERAGLLALQGNGHACAEELDRADDAAVWARVRRLQLPAHDIDDIDIGRWRCALRFGDSRPALAQLPAAIAEARARSRHRRALRLRVLLAIAQARGGETTAARATMAAALRDAGTEGFVRLVVDEGEPAGALVRTLASAAALDEASLGQPLHAEYLQRLARAFGPGAPIELEPASLAQALSVEPLTRTEIRVLQLLAEGYSNGAMAEKLFVSDSTVRTHLRNINMKLDARSRTQAVAIGRRLGLIG